MSPTPFITTSDSDGIGHKASTNQKTRYGFFGANPYK